jgi:ferredoxin
MAFLDELLERYPDQIEVFASDENEGSLDVYALTAKSNAEVYCCGPESLMSTVAGFVPADRMHLERFVALTRESIIPAEPIEVTCKKSKKSFVVDVDESILDALEENGLPIIGSCKKGVCGTCEVRVVEGKPIHLDSVLDDEEKDRLKVMYPCVSRAEAGKLILDI